MNATVQARPYTPAGDAATECIETTHTGSHKFLLEGWTVSPCQVMSHFVLGPRVPAEQ
jgi:hypothetical protein